MKLIIVVMCLLLVGCGIQEDSVGNTKPTAPAVESKTLVISIDEARNHFKIPSAGYRCMLAKVPVSSYQDPEGALKHSTGFRYINVPVVEILPNKMAKAFQLVDVNGRSKYEILYFKLKDLTASPVATGAFDAEYSYEAEKMEADYGEGAGEPSPYVTVYFRSLVPKLCPSSEMTYDLHDKQFIP